MLSLRNIAAAAALVLAAGPAVAHQTIRTPAEACKALRAAGIIPGDAPARIVGLPDLPGHRPFLCLRKGESGKGLRVRFTLAPRFEDEPTVEVLGTAREPVGCMTDTECDAAGGAAAFADYCANGGFCRETPPAAPIRRVSR